jgi:hypothetical protein
MTVATVVRADEPLRSSMVRPHLGGSRPSIGNLCSRTLREKRSTLAKFHGRALQRFSSGPMTFRSGRHRQPALQTLLRWQSFDKRSSLVSRPHPLQSSLPAIGSRRRKKKTSLFGIQRICSNMPKSLQRLNCSAPLKQVNIDAACYLITKNDVHRLLAIAVVGYFFGPNPSPKVLLPRCRIGLECRGLRL